MTPSSASNAPLTAETLDRLGDLLDQHAVVHGGVPLEAADGFLAAAVVSPGAAVTLAECLPAILGDQPWPQSTLRSEAIGALEALWRDVERRVASDPETSTDDVSPVIGVPPGFDAMDDGQIEATGYQMGSNWAFGFALGADLRSADWENLLDSDEDLRADFYDIFALMPDEVFGGDVDAADDDEEDAEPLTHAERVEVINALPQILHAMYSARKPN